MKKFKYLFFVLTTFTILWSCKTESIIKDDVKTIVIRKKLDPYTEVQYGNMPLIISVPHGGLASPTDIPDRSCPNITTAIDSKTIELVYAIDSVFKADYAIQPYIVVNYLKRIKLDQNREILEATCNNANIQSIWNNYHSAINDFILKINQKYSQALFIDLHGHGHTKQRLELGYLVPATALRNPSTIQPQNTSYYNQLLNNSFLNSNQFMTSATAFGTLMGNKNFASVPSQQDNAPLATDDYFDGGYNTKTYTSSVYPKVYGWQIESNFTGVRDNQNSRVAFAKAFTKSIIEYFQNTTTLKTADFGK